MKVMKKQYKIPSNISGDLSFGLGEHSAPEGKNSFAVGENSQMIGSPGKTVGCYIFFDDGRVFNWCEDLTKKAKQNTWWKRLLARIFKS